jgi:hypothetical protein
LVKIRVPDLLEVPISLVLCHNDSDEGHGHSWTVVNYILQAKLIGGLGGDEDPLPPDGGNPHPLPNIPFGGIWDDLVDGNNHMGENVAPNMGNAAPAGHAAPAADGEPMVHTPPQDNAQNNNEVEAAVEAVDAISAFHKMLTDVLATFPDALDKLSDDNVTGARIQMVDVSADGYAERKCIVTVFTAQEPSIAKSSVTISEIYDTSEETSAGQSAQINSTNDVVHMNQVLTDTDMPDTMSMFEQQDTNLSLATATPAYKRKNEEAPVDVKEVRRSRRIAVIAAGYKDKNAADAALAREAEKDMQKNHKAEKEKGKKKTVSKMTKKNLSHEFEADVIDKSAPPPPELPIKTIQAIAVDQCQIPPSEVSEEKLLDKSG